MREMEAWCCGSDPERSQKGKVSQEGVGIREGTGGMVGFCQEPREAY